VLNAALCITGKWAPEIPVKVDAKHYLQRFGTKIVAVVCLNPLLECNAMLTALVKEVAQIRKHPHATGLEFLISARGSQEVQGKLCDETVQKIVEVLIELDVKVSSIWLCHHPKIHATYTLLPLIRKHASIYLHLSHCGLGEQTMARCAQFLLQKPSNYWYVHFEGNPGCKFDDLVSLAAAHLKKKVEILQRTPLFRPQKSIFIVGGQTFREVPDLKEDRETWNAVLAPISRVSIIPYGHEGPQGLTFGDVLANALQKYEARTAASASAMPSLEAATSAFSSSGEAPLSAAPVELRTAPRGWNMSHILEDHERSGTLEERTAAPTRNSPWGVVPACDAVTLSGLEWPTL